MDSKIPKLFWMEITVRPRIQYRYLITTIMKCKCCISHQILESCNQRRCCSLYNGRFSLLWFGDTISNCRFYNIIINELVDDVHLLFFLCENFFPLPSVLFITCNFLKMELEIFVQVCGALKAWLDITIGKA